MFWAGIAIGLFFGVIIGLTVMSMCHGAASDPDEHDDQINGWEREAGFHEQHARLGKLTVDEREHLIAAAAENRLLFVPPGE